jgi:hypothetical protein
VGTQEERKFCMEARCLLGPNDASRWHRYRSIRIVYWKMAHGMHGDFRVLHYLCDYLGLLAQCEKGFYLNRFKIETRVERFYNIDRWYLIPLSVH